MWRAKEQGFVFRFDHGFPDDLRTLVLFFDTEEGDKTIKEWCNGGLESVTERTPLKVED